MRRRGPLTALTVLTVLAALLLLLGCTDVDDGETPSSATGSTEVEEQRALPPDPAADGEVPIGVRDRVRVHYDVDAPGRVDELTLSYEPPRFALRAGQRLVIGDGDDLVACGVRGDAECMVVDDTAPPEIREAMLSEGLAPVLAVARAEADPRHATPTRPTGRGSEEIAGRWARCATVAPGGIEGLEDAHVEVCVDALTGVGLRWSVEQPGTGTTTLEAVEIGLPLPRDFVPSDEPIDPLEQPDADEIGTRAPGHAAVRSGRSPGRA